MRDFYFDDRDWTIRYFDVDTGPWLTGRRVLISLETVSGQIWADRVIPVSLTQEQVRTSSGIDMAKPVSRQHEIDLRRHYGWPRYWGVVFPEAATAATRGVAPLDAPTAKSPPPPASPAPAEAQHLRSTSEVTRYHIQALDGPIGHVVDFLTDERTWRIRYLVVDTRNWWPGKKVIIAPGWLREVSWYEPNVYIDLSRESLKASPAYDPNRPFTSEYAGRLHDHDMRPRYPDWEPDHKSPESRRNFGA